MIFAAREIPSHFILLLFLRGNPRLFATPLKRSLDHRQQEGAVDYGNDKGDPRYFPATLLSNTPNCNTTYGFILFGRPDVSSDFIQAKRGLFLHAVARNEVDLGELGYVEPQLCCKA